jgi:hypothetical protein
MSSENAEDSNCDEVLATDDPIGDSYELGGPTDVEVAESEQLDWSTLTVAALKAELAERGLQTTGRKADLVARLEANVSGTDHSETELRNGESKTENEPDTSQEPQEETDEVEDDIPDGDEFVEWNEDADHEGPADESKVGDDTVESLKLVEVVDELKLETDEPKESGETKTSGDKDDVNVEEGDVKKEDGELSVDVHREKDLFYLTWQSKKLTVPFKGEITKDMLTLTKLQTVIIYPVVLADLYSEEIKKYAEQATGMEVELEDTLPGKPPKGYLKLKLNTYEEAQQAIEALKTYKEGITVKNFSKEDNESHIMNRLRKEDCERKGPIIFRLVYVGNLPADTTEAALREHFPEALKAIIPHNEETLERLG